MRALVLLALLLLVALAVWAAVSWVRERAAPRTLARGGAWELEERSDGEMVVVRAVCAGEEPLLVGAVPFAGADFDMKIEEVRAQGRYKLAALNSGVERRRR